jgi:peptidoglycan/LPS O-acetylase OafA/YrhL
VEFGAAGQGDGARRAFRPDIEGLRAVAVLAVLAYHGGVPGFSGGYVGVDVFFVVSGYLITGLLLEEAAGTGRISLLAFYGRRAQRLLPAATVVLAVTMVGARFAGGPLELRDTAEAAQAAAVFLANVFFAGEESGYFAAERPSALLHFWSLAVEEQFYLVWPPALALLVRGARGEEERVRRRVTAVLAACVVVSFAWCVAQTGSSPDDAFFLLPSRIWELAGGALLGVAASAIRIRRGRGAMATAGLLLIGVAIVGFGENDPFPGWRAVVPVVGTLLVLQAGRGTERGALPSVLGNRFAQVVGRYSYSLYLWHWPLLIVAAMARPGILNRWYASTAVVLASVPLAVASYHLIEDPIRRLRPLRRAPGRAIAAGLSLVAASSAAAIVGIAAPRFDVGRELVVAARLPTDFVPSNLQPSIPAAEDDPSPLYGNDRCDTSRRTAADLPCVFGSGEPRVALLGDSHAAMWFSAVRAFTEQLGGTLEVNVTAGCSPLDYHDDSACAQNRRAVLERLAERPPDIVVLIEYGRLSMDRGASMAEWRASLGRAVEQLSSQSDLLLFGESPTPPGRGPSCMARNLDDLEPCEPDPDDPLYRELISAGRDAAQRSGAGFVDLDPIMCPDDHCPVVMGDRLVYTDSDHISESFATLVRSEVVAAMRAALRSTEQQRSAS